LSIDIILLRKLKKLFLIKLLYKLFFFVIIVFMENSNLPRPEYSNLQPVVKPEPPKPQNPNQPAEKSGFKVYLLYGVLIVLGIFLAKVAFDMFSPRSNGKPKSSASYSKSSKNPAGSSAGSSQTKTSSLRPAQKAEPIKALKKRFREATEPYILSGVYFDADKGYCIINDQILEEGDEIEGAEVVKITLDEVVLDSKGKTIRLSTHK
jgi:cytoskeletal protein RodZ